MVGWFGVAFGGQEAQTRFDLDKDASSWVFDFAWRGPDGGDSVHFELPAAPLLADRGEETYLPRAELDQAAVRAMRQYAKGLKGVDLQVIDAPKGGVRLKASGRGDVKGAVKRAEVVGREAQDRWLADHQFTRTRDGSVTFDHALLVADYTDELAPVARALRDGAADDRAFVERALSFVQSIPYEARKRKGGDPGYRRPLALLSRDRGDCDSKAVLFLAIVRSELPDLPLAVVYVPGHALVGVGLDPDRGESTFRADGAKFVFAEPVGPAQAPLGKVGRGHKRGREVRVVPLDG